MKVGGIVLLLGFVALYISFIEAVCSSRSAIRRVYVVRRSLQIGDYNLPKVCHLAHSGLIIEMRDGKQCVLEYMDDGKSHLYDARPTRTTTCWFKSCKKLVMNDDKGRSYTWTRQKIGTALPWWRRITPQAAKNKMQSLMGSNYHLLTNNCHLAQEKLRKSWGLSVRKSYSDLNTLCTCIRPIRFLLPTTGLPGLVKAYCTLVD